MYFAVAIFCLIINYYLVTCQFLKNHDYANQEDQETTTSTADEHSFIVLIEILFTDGFKRTCAGTIIHENVVITAAHCFLIEGYDYIQPELSVSFVVLGTQKMHETGYEQYLPIERILLHPQFNGWTADIALVYTFVDMTFERPGQILSLLEEELPTQIDSNITIVSWAKFGYSETFQLPQGKPSTYCPRSGSEEEVKKPKKYSRFAYQPSEESSERRNRIPKNVLKHKLRSNKERDGSKEVIDEPKKGIEHIIREEVSKYSEVDKVSEIPNDSKNYDFEKNLDKLFESHNNYNDFSEFKGLGLRKGIGLMKRKSLKSNEFIQKSKYYKHNHKFELDKYRHKVNHETKISWSRRQKSKKKPQENFSFKSLYLGRRNFENNKSEEHIKLKSNPYISNIATEAITSKTSTSNKSIQKSDNQIKNLKSMYKNWRRQMGGLELKLAFEVFGFVNAQVCKKVIKRAEPKLVSKINSNDVLCYTSQNHILTDADAGAPALYQDRLMAVTLGSIQYEGEQVAVGMRVSCFCEWISDNLPSRVNKLACCKNCCSLTPSKPPTTKVSSNIVSTFKRHRNL